VRRRGDPGPFVAGRIGPRSVTIAGLALVGLACGGFALAHGAAALDLARVVQGVGAAALSAGALTWLLANGGDTNPGG
jgi:MFS family permease